MKIKVSHVHENVSDSTFKHENLRLSITDLLSIKKLSEPIMSSQTNNESPPKYSIEKVSENDSKAVIEFLKATFWKNEPLNVYLQMDDCIELEEWCVKDVNEGTSFKAVNSDGEIIGVILNAFMHKPADDAVHVKEAEQCQHEKFKKVLVMIEYIEERFHLFDHYPGLTLGMDTKIISVHPKYGGIGIGNKLIAESIKCAKENNVQLFHVMCSSHYSARVCEKLGFEKVYELPYVDYVINGENPFAPALPHTATRVFVQKL